LSVASRRPRGHAARALEEALGAVAAPAVRDAILGSALSRAGLIAPPDDGETLDLFVHGAFRHAIAERLGDDAADEVLAGLWPMLVMIARRPQSHSARPVPVTNAPRQRATARPPSPLPEDGDDASGVMVVVGHGKTVRSGDSLAVVIAVMSDAVRTRELAVRMAGRALVRPVLDLMEMAEAIEDHRGDVPVVLFDCARPPFHLESVATFASELPPGSWLALLDASPENHRAARGFAGATITIAQLSSTSGLDEIARRCLALFD